MKMKKFKKAAALLLTAAIIVLGGCGSETGEPAGEESTNYQPEEGAAYVESDYDIIVDGAGVAGARHRIEGDSLLPTHVSLYPIAAALGQELSWNQDTGRIAMGSPSGTILMLADSTEFEVDGEIITLAQPVILAGDNEYYIYVPIPFFRLVYSAGEAYFSGGNVIINTYASADMF